MKKLIILLIICLLTGCTQSQDIPVLSEEEVQEKIKNIQKDKGFMNNSTLDTLSYYLKDNKENQVYSPINIYIALSLLALITDNNSQKQILDVLQVKDSDTLKAYLKELIDHNTINNEEIRSIIAHSIWLRNDETYKQDIFILDYLEENYLVETHTGDMGSDSYNTELQDWINKQTRDRLKDNVSNTKLDPDTFMALVSTIDYKSKWLEQFDEENTYKETFYGSKKKDVDMMHQTSRYDYYYGKNFQSISMKTEAGGDMFIVLPEKNNVYSLLKDKELLSCLKNRDTYKKYKSTEVFVSLPKFDFTSKMDIIDILKNLGIDDVFDYTKSDFSPISGAPLYVDKVDHNARITVEENGVEATAYTILDMKVGAMPMKPIEFNCNRPFLFFLTGADGSILFTGIVNNPS